MLTHTPVGLDEIVETFGSLDTPNFESRYVEPFSLPYPLFYGINQPLNPSCGPIVQR